MSLTPHSREYEAPPPLQVGLELTIKAHMVVRALGDVDIDHEVHKEPAQQDYTATMLEHPNQ